MNPTVPLHSKKVLLRKQYLNNLRLQASNDLKNYNATKLFDITGQLPLTPPDMTSVSDKYKDLENLKVKVRGELMTITDGENADSIVQSISPTLLVFLANNMPYITEKMKKKNALGVLAPVFITYLKQLHRDSEKDELMEYGNTDTDSDSDDEPNVNRVHPINLNPILETPTPKSRPVVRIPPENKSPSRELDAVIKQYGGVDKFKAYLKNNGINEVESSEGEIISIDKCTKAGTTIGNRFNNTNVLDLYHNISNKKIKGKGLKHQQSTGLLKASSYLQFGRYTINIHKLNDDILMMKTPKAGAIPYLPTTKISSSLCHILKTLVNNQVVEFEMISNLNDDDKRLLHKIATKSHIQISVPSPDKDKQQQEMDRFNILKGEIIAGNDNKNMIKEFKVMLLKFMNNGIIPRRQALDILTDITALGH